MEHVKRKLWKAANTEDFVEWFIEGCYLSDLPISKISTRMIHKVDSLWEVAFRRNDYPKFSHDKDRSLFVRNIINSHLDRLGVTMENKIGGKINADTIH